MELLVFAILLTFAGAQESQLEGPQNTLDFVGSIITLKCLSPYRNCSGTDWQKYLSDVDWQKYFSGYKSPFITVFKGPRTILNSNVTDRDRYSVDNSSGCDLVIKNVQLKDAGRFICSTIMSSSQVTKTAFLIILESQPKCTLNVSLNDTIEGDVVRLNCEMSYNGADIGASMNWRGVTDAPAAVKNGNTISRPHSVVASAPEVSSFTCETSFAFETVDQETPIAGLATNRIPNASCSTSVIEVLYSVRDVQLSPSYSNYPPGTEITCAAKGNPSPTFKWQENEDNGGVWMDIQTQKGNRFTTSNVSSKKYRCVAMNVVKGKNYNANSSEFQVNPDLTSSRTCASEGRLGIGVGIGLLVAILLATVAFAILLRLRYLEFHSRPAIKSSDGGAENEMSSASHQLSTVHSSASRPKAPIPGEQESAYASLGEDRDANEYASLEQRQKAKPRKQSKP